jgi:hypothetical protein
MKTFQQFCSEAYIKGVKPGSQRFSDLGGYAALKAGGGKAALRAGSSIEDVLHAGKRAKEAQVKKDISARMSRPLNAPTTSAPKPMDDFAAGGGAAKMKANPGMTRDQVIALGKKNLAH